MSTTSLPSRPDVVGPRKPRLTRTARWWFTLRDRWSAAGGARSDRGDVPGWVLITLMTAGIVTVLWRLAGPRLLEILTNALNSVSGA